MNACGSPFYPANYFGYSMIPGCCAYRDTKLSREVPVMWIEYNICGGLPPWIFRIILAQYPKSLTHRPVLLRVLHRFVMTPKILLFRRNWISDYMKIGKQPIGSKGDDKLQVQFTLIDLNSSIERLNWAHQAWPGIGAFVVVVVYKKHNVKINCDVDAKL